MINSNKTCFLFTNSSPYGNDEIFVKNEIPFLTRFFKKVVIFPLNTGKEDEVRENSAFETKYIFNDLAFNSKQVLKENLFLVIRLFLIEFSSHPKQSILKFRNLLSNIVQQIFRAKKLLKELEYLNLSEIVFYSYWMDRWVTILGIVKLLKPEIKIITRAHAFDLYEEDNRNGIIIFRKFQLQSVDKVFAVSNHGKNYLKSKYPKYSNKFECAYLGSQAHHDINIIPNDGKLHIVSCGSVQDRKRIKEIPEILSHLKQPFLWTHFGDGEEMELLKANILKYKIKDYVVLKGHVSNQDFLSFLKEEKCSLFLSVSRNEGLPYSIIEAISYGLPVFATDAMGCREIANDITGETLLFNFDHQLIALKIENFMASEKNNENYRKTIQNYHHLNFNNQINYNKFYKEISA